MFLPHTLSPMIGTSCETQKPVEQRLAQGSHRIVCHIPADELARLTAARTDGAMTNYPRDFIGYAANPPDPRWPGSARLAINFVVNYEEGGERSILHGDQTSETRLSDLATAVPIRNGRDLNMESAYEYGARVGAWRLLKLLQDRRVPFTAYVVGMALERNPPVAAAMAAAGCDFVDHGWRWIDYHDVEIDVEREHIRRSVEVISRLTGSRPLGWYVGTPSPNTRRLVVDEGGFLYDSDAYNDELPYWNHEFGRPHLIIPHTLDDNDTRLARGLGWGQAGDFFTCWRRIEFGSAAGSTSPGIGPPIIHPWSKHRHERQTGEQLHHPQ
jgi:peptidoglycan/xylan/chitin deacetylase (PgdA/CDA1 family)